MASPWHRAGWEPLPTSPVGRGLPSAVLFVSWPRAPAAKPPGGEDALRAFTWVFSRLSSPGWQTNAFFQHSDVLLQCLCLSVALRSQYFRYYPLSLFPSLLPSSSVLQSFHSVSAIFKALNSSVHSTLVLVRVY